MSESKEMNKFSNLDIAIQRKLNHLKRNSISSPINLLKSGVMDIYSRNSIQIPNLDENDTVEGDFHNLYNHKKRDSIFEVGLSRIESQDNMIGSGFNMSGIWDLNVDSGTLKTTSAGLKVMPCFQENKHHSPNRKSVRIETNANVFLIS